MSPKKSIIPQTAQYKQHESAIAYNYSNRIYPNEPIFGYTLHSFIDLEKHKENRSAVFIEKEGAWRITVAPPDSNFHALNLLTRPNGQIIDINLFNYFYSYEEALSCYAVIAEAFRAKYTYAKPLTTGKTQSIGNMRDFDLGIRGVPSEVKLNQELEIYNKYRTPYDTDNYIIHPAIAEAYVLLTSTTRDSKLIWVTNLRYMGQELLNLKDEMREEQKRKTKEEASKIKGI